MTAARLTARVKWFDNRRGWGFLVLDDGRNAFVHFAAIEDRGYRVLVAGEPVECDVQDGPRGLHATAVHRRAHQPTGSDDTRGQPERGVSEA